MRRAEWGSRRRLLGAGLLAPLGPALTACESLLPGSGPPPRLFELTPKTTFRDGLPMVDWQLGLELPFAATSLNTTRIALQNTPTEVEYYARASWTDRAPLMVQTVMIQSFEASGGIVAVGREAVALRADYLLRTELRKFEAEYFDEGRAVTGAPLVRVRINAKLVAMPRRSIVGAKDFEATWRASTNQIDAVVDAFDEALGKVLKNLVEWTLLEGERAKRLG
jgi:cholesterol transport system auxiliary component